MHSRIPYFRVFSNNEYWVISKSIAKSARAVEWKWFVPTRQNFSRPWTNWSQFTPPFGRIFFRITLYIHHQSQYKIKKKYLRKVLFDTALNFGYIIFLGIAPSTYLDNLMWSLPKLCSRFTKALAYSYCLLYTSDAADE